MLLRLGFGWFDNNLFQTEGGEREREGEGEGYRIQTCMGFILRYVI